jgi:glutamine cyclotransferase
MSKGKRIGIIVLLVVIIGAFALGPLLKGCKAGGDDPTEEVMPAVFSFEDNLATPYGKVVPIPIEVRGDVEKVELFYNDSIFETWSHPKGKLLCQLNAGFYGLGARELNLVSTLKDGTTVSDNRLLRVLSDEAPQELTATIVQAHPHSLTAFTEGLEFNDGILYESTGLEGQSKIMQLNFGTGAIQKEIGLDASYFGEGITILGDKIYQVTYHNGKCLVYDKKTLQILSDMPYTGEGWGLTNNGKQIIMSDGTERLVFRNPETFQIERTIEVYDQVGPRVRLNELEYVDGKIYANIWMLDIVLVIDAATGKVLAEIDGAAVAAAGRATGEAMNGIAYNPASKKWYFTGKNWSKLLEVSVR